MALVNELIELGMVPQLAKKLADAIGAAGVAPAWGDITGVPANVTAIAEANPAAYSETPADISAVLVGVGLMEEDAG